MADHNNPPPEGSSGGAAWKRAGKFISGKGFSIVLFLCIAAIGVSMYVLFSAGRTQIDSEIPDIPDIPDIGLSTTVPFRTDATTAPESRSRTRKAARTSRSRSLTAQSTSGSVCVETAALEALTAETVSGSIALSHVRCGEISVKSTSGRIGLTDAIAEAGLRVKSVSGSIALEDCDGGDVRIQTTSGSVEGTLLSDKLFVADSTSGSINVPLSRGAEKCEITTVSGSIAIEIGR